VQAREPALQDLSRLERLDAPVLDEWADVARLRTVASLVDRAIGGECLVGATGWGPFTMACEFCGRERVMAALHQERSLLRDLVRRMVEISSRYFRGFVENGVRIISIGEPEASGTSISAADFEELVVPGVAALIESLKDTGVYCLLHICGDISDRLHLVPSTGAHVLSVDQHIDLRQASDAVGARMAFAGNVDPDIMGSGTSEEVDAATGQCMESAAGADNFILMTGCDIPPETPLSNIGAFFSAGKKREGGRTGTCPTVSSRG
jgi:uroporphyrinogen decarboxylase